jgi:hypothetical protein
MRTPLRTAAALAAVPLLLAGCTGGGDGGGDRGEAAAGASAEPSSGATEVVGETTLPYSGRDGEAVVEVHALRARGELVQLTLTFTAEGGDDGATASLYDLWGSAGSSPYLVDTASLNRHDVVAPEGGSPLAPDVVGTSLSFGEPRSLSYTFAAPPENVASMDVYVGAAPPVTDVPVLR